MMDIDKEILLSLRSLEPQAEHRGWEAVYREHVQGMARSGALAILTKVIDQALARYRDTLLGASTPSEVDLARGGILALRGIWLDFRVLGRDPDEDLPHEDTTEKNEFAILKELKEDLTSPY